MAKLGRKRLAREVARLLAEPPGRRPHIMRMVAGYLVATKQTNQVHLLLQDIADVLYERDKHLVADIHQAFPSSAQVDQAVTGLLKSVTGARIVELRHHINPELIGGIVVRTPRLEYDASVSSQLKQIARGV